MEIEPKNADGLGVLRQGTWLPTLAVSYHLALSTTTATSTTTAGPTDRSTAGPTDRSAVGGCFLGTSASATLGARGATRWRRRREQAQHQGRWDAASKSTHACPSRENRHENREFPPWLQRTVARWRAYPHHGEREGALCMALLRSLATSRHASERRLILYTRSRGRA